MAIMDENVNWRKLAHLLSNFFLNLMVPFCEFAFASKLLMVFLNVHTRERKYLYYTHVSTYLV